MIDLLEIFDINMIDIYPFQNHLQAYEPGRLLQEQRVNINLIYIYIFFFFYEMSGAKAPAQGTIIKTRSKRIK